MGASERVRLVDVARAVGVSAKTVSNVVHDTGNVSTDVRAKVRAAIAELGYQPNLAARQLRTGASAMIGLVVPDLREPYFAEFAASLCTQAQERSLTVLVSQTQGDHRTERRLCDAVGLPALDGLVMSPLALQPSDLANRSSSVSLVLTGEHGSRLATPEVPHVGVDNIAAAADATAHLIGQGRSRIAVIGAQTTGSAATSELRLEGYRRALTAAHLPFVPELVAEVPAFTRAAGSQAAEMLLRSRTSFDGLFCFNDTMAFGAIHTLALHGIRVPDDVMIIGFDDIEETRYTVPPFATVNPSTEQTTATILDHITGAAPLSGGRHVTMHKVVDRLNAGHRSGAPSEGAVPDARR